jgi:hypothetical protein
LEEQPVIASKFVKLLLCAALVATAAVNPGWAQVSTAAKPPPKPPVRQACFFGRDANNFVAVDNQTVNVRVGVRQVYQLKLFAPCIGVSWSESIALVSRPGAFICSGTANAVDLFIHTTTGPQRCPVTSIRELSDEYIAAMPKKQRP